MFRRFLEWNKRLSSRLDRLFTDRDDAWLLKSFLRAAKQDDVIADVGGGKKPAFLSVGMNEWRTGSYEGIDLDAEELALAEPGSYSAVHVADITDPPLALAARYDRIVCRNTLEHVLDDRKAMAGLAKMLKPEGRLYLKAPCRLAVFAQLNRRLPQRIKLRILHGLFPDKAGDGFPAYYFGCTESEMRENAASSGLVPQSDTNRVYFSSYFTFFLPFYLMWRIITLFQLIFQRDYCESFEMVFCKDCEATGADS